MGVRHVVTSVVAFAMLATPVHASWLDGLGSSSDTADRQVSFPAAVDCNLKVVRALAERHVGVRQFVVLNTDAFSDTVGEAFVAAQRSSGEWVCQTVTSEARFGRSGTTPLVERRSGDGTTPAGVFPLGSITAWDGQRLNMFGNSADPGVHSGIEYRDVQPEDCWGATPNDSDYNHLVDDPGCPGPDDEWLQRFGGVYSHAAVIGANLDPDTEATSGDAPGETPYAAAIFLHRHSYGNGRTSGESRATSGCVSLLYDDLVVTLTAIDPDLDPHFAIGPTDWLLTDA